MCSWKEPPNKPVLPTGRATHFLGRPRPAADRGVGPTQRMSMSSERSYFDSPPQPAWNRPGDVAEALHAVATASTEEQAQQAYHRTLYSLGNNHAGTYYPIALWVLPELSELLRSGGPITREIVLDVFVDLVGSFEPEGGHESCVGPDGSVVDLSRALHASISSLAPAIVAYRASVPTDSRGYELAAHLLELLAEGRSA